MKKYILSAAFLSLLITACSKSDFDPKVNEYLTDQRKEELKADVQTKANLLQVELKGMYNNNVALQSNYHDSFGLKSIHLSLDLTGLDMVQASYHWFGYDYYFDMRNANYSRTSFMWSFLYRQISAINTILADYFSEVPTEQVLYQKYAELKSLRAVYYFYLVNLYQHSYKGNESKLGVPLMLKPTDGKLPRATVAEVYRQMEQDLSVVDDARFTITESKEDVDKAVAAAYLAKVYAHKEEWAKVAQYAQIVLNASDFNYTSMAEVQGAKWDISNTSWLWGYDITQQTTSSFGSFYSHIDNTIAQGYAGGSGAYKNMYSNLYAKIADTDVRKKIYINSTLFPTIADRYGLPDYANVKYATDQRFLSDYCFIRIEDPFFLYVEALVEQNNLSAAKTALEDFMHDYRDLSYTLTATTQAAMRDEVRIQRRIELWGEGTSFFDFKRWHLGVDRNEAGSNHTFMVKVPAGDKRWVYQIPQDEIESNSQMVQNE